MGVGFDLDVPAFSRKNHIIKTRNAKAHTEKSLAT
jgi:hypothetical protein